MWFGLAHLQSDLASMHPRHRVVENYHLHRLIGEDLQPRRSIQGGEHPVAGALQQDLSNLEADLFVIDAEYEMGDF